MDAGVGEGSGLHNGGVWWKSRPLKIILLLAILSVRLIMLQPILREPQRSLLTDSYGYLDLAESLRTRGTFEANLYEESVRTPGYPLFLTLVDRVVGAGIVPIVIVQVLLAVSVAGLVYVAGSTAADHRVGWAAAFLWALNPNSLFWPLTVMTETLFAFLLAASLTATVLAMRRESLWLFGAGGLLLGLAACVRPIGVYLIPIWAALLLVRGARSSSWTRGWRAAVVLGFVACGPVFAWSARNYLVHQEFFFSKTGGVTLRTYILARALADARGVSRSDASQMISDSTDLVELTRQIVRESPWSIPSVVAAGIVRTAVGTEVNTWLFIIGSPGGGEGILTGLLSGDLRSLQAGLASMFASGRNAISPLLAIWGGAYALAAWLAVAVGWIRHSRLDRTGRAAQWVGALSAFYLLAAPLANGDARFRVPLDPLLAFLGGLAWLGGSWARRQSASPDRASVGEGARP